MALNLEMKRNLSMNQIFVIYKFELFLHRKRYYLMLILGLVMYNLTAIILAFSPPPDVKLFMASTVGQIGSLLVFLTLFFAGGVLADEFDKGTALTNFTKTGRDNFFIGKSLAVFTSVLIWNGIPLFENIIFSLALYQQVPLELFSWFVFYCLVGGTYVAIYLLFSAIFRSGTQAMVMAFFFIMAGATAFGILLGAPYYFPIYAEIAVIQIFDPSAVDGVFIIDLSYVIIMLLAYLIPCLVLAYLRFRTRDV